MHTMLPKPIFVATHPRACSTAFERVFMTRRDILTCVHEPFGDAFYYGPERLSPRYEEDEKGRLDSGFSNSTYKTIFERLERDEAQGKRLFIKDMAQYWIPPEGKPASIAPSLVSYKRGVGTPVSGEACAQVVNGVTKPPYPYNTESEPNNPSVVPDKLLREFHFAFLIRHPAYSIPSYYRCTIPPLDEVTGFYNFMPAEAGYTELRRLFDYLRLTGQVGPQTPTLANGTEGKANQGVKICVVDADDLLDNPSGVIQAFCKNVGIEYDPSMLSWNDEESHAFAKEAFEKWKGFHDDAIESTELKPREHAKVLKSDEEFYADWKSLYGEEGANVIRDTVAANMSDYNYLKKFALKA